MNAWEILLLALGFCLAFANGANDVSKGIATLVGSGVSDYRRAVLWGTLCTGLGGVASAAVAGAMVETFGRGLLSPGTAPILPAALAAVFGAAVWVGIATAARLPVSTTHALVGSIAGAAVAAYGPGGVEWTAVGTRMALPLLLSPAVAFAISSASLRIGGGGRGTPHAAASDCICADVVPAAELLPVPVQPTRPDLFTATGPELRVTVAPRGECPPAGAVVLRLTFDHAHWLTSGATSFARGLNDAPKMAALMLASGTLAGGLPAPGTAFFLVVAGMVAGSLAAGRRVTHLLAERVTRLDPREGFVVNLVTAVLVAAGAVGGLPMSTTHVASASIVAAGAHHGRSAVAWKIVRDIALAWVITLPASAALGAVAFAALSMAVG